MNKAQISIHMARKLKTLCVHIILSLLKEYSPIFAIPVCEYRNFSAVSYAANINSFQTYKDLPIWDNIRAYKPAQKIKTCVACELIMRGKTTTFVSRELKITEQNCKVVLRSKILSFGNDRRTVCKCSGS